MTTTDNSPMVKSKISVPDTSLAPMLSGKAAMPASKYHEAVLWLGKKLDRPYSSGRATRVVKTQNGIGIKYHNTIVVEYTERGLILNSDGYRTMTTKARINEALAKLSGNVSVYQNKGVWYLSKSVKNPRYTESFIKEFNPNYNPELPTVHHINGSDSNWDYRYVDNPDHDPTQPYYLNVYTIPFVDGISVGWDGELLDYNLDETNAEVERIRRTTRQIKAYVDEVIRRIDQVHSMTENDYDDSVLPLPSAGDCWYCYGGITGNADHVQMHLDEMYIVPSLLIRAVRELGSQFDGWVLQALMEGNTTTDYEIEILKRDMRSILRRYLKRLTGIAPR